MVVVIGATGFIGTYLVEELIENGYEVCVTGRNNESAKEYYKNKGVTFIKLDLSNKEDFNKLPKENVEAVILLAGLLPANIRGEENVQEYIDTNVNGTVNVLEYCKNNNIKKLISTNSYADVQNSWSEGYYITEKEKRNYKLTGDHAVYIISKNAATDIIEYYNNKFDMKGMIFRLPPVYGVGPHDEIYVSGKYYKTGIQTFIEKAKKGEAIEIWGNKDLSRDIVYVKDVVDAFVKAIQSNKGKGVYNITSGVSTTLEEQVKTVIKLFSPTDKESEIIYRPDKKNNTNSFIFSIEKAKMDFGYNPKYIPFERMMEDYKKELSSERFEFLVKSRRKK